MDDFVFSLIKDAGGIERIAESSNNPAEFITGIVRLKNMTLKQAAESIGMEYKHLMVVLSYVRSGKQSVSTRLQYKMAKGLDIDPYLMAKVWSEWDMKRIIKQESNGN